MRDLESAGPGGGGRPLGPGPPARPIAISYPPGGLSSERVGILDNEAGVIRLIFGEQVMAVSQEEHLQELSKGYRFDWEDADHSVFEPKRGLSPAVVEESRH